MDDERARCWHMSCIVTGLLIVFAVAFGWAVVHYVQLYINSQHEERDRAEYVRDCQSIDIIPADQLPIFVEDEE